MSDEKQVIKPASIEISKDEILTVTIPLNLQSSAIENKVSAYGTLKVAEEQVSIYFMQKAMRERQATIIKPSKPFTPGVH